MIGFCARKEKMEYVSRPGLMEKLTSSEMQQKIKAMSGTDAYNEFLTLVNDEEEANVLSFAQLGEWLAEQVKTSTNYEFIEGCMEILRRLLDLKAFVILHGNDKNDMVQCGKWNEKEHGATSTIFECSRCGRTVEVRNDYFGEPSQHIEKHYPYCHCGAYMGADNE